MNQIQLFAENHIIVKGQFFWTYIINKNNQYCIYNFTTTETKPKNN